MGKSWNKREPECPSLCRLAYFSSVFIIITVYSLCSSNVSAYTEAFVPVGFQELVLLNSDSETQASSHSPQKLPMPRTNEGQQIPFRQLHKNPNSPEQRRIVFPSHRELISPLQTENSKSRPIILQPIVQYVFHLQNGKTVTHQERGESKPNWPVSRMVVKPYYREIRTNNDDMVMPRLATRPAIVAKNDDESTSVLPTKMTNGAIMKKDQNKNQWIQQQEEPDVTTMRSSTSIGMNINKNIGDNNRLRKNFVIKSSHAASPKTELEKSFGDKNKKVKVVVVKEKLEEVTTTTTTMKPGKIGDVQSRHGGGIKLTSTGGKVVNPQRNIVQSKVVNPHVKVKVIPSRVNTKNVPRGNFTPQRNLMSNNKRRKNGIQRMKLEMKNQNLQISSSNPVPKLINEPQTPAAPEHDRIQGHFEIIDPSEASHLFSHVTEQIVKDLSASMERDYQKKIAAQKRNRMQRISSEESNIIPRRSNEIRRMSRTRQRPFARRNSNINPRTQRHNGQPLVSYVNPNDYQAYYKHYVNSRPPMDSEIYEAIKAILQNDP